MDAASALKLFLRYFCYLYIISYVMLYNSLSYNGIQYNIIQDTVIYSNIIEGSLEVKLPTIWTVGRAEVGRVRKEKKRSEKIREERRCRYAKRSESRDSLCFIQ